MSLLSTFKDRGCLHTASHFEELEKALETESLTFYCGFDPTADSLHVGSMLPLIMMRRLQQAGHTPIVLLGSATGMIGDPSFKSEERKLLSEEVIQTNIKGIEAQVSKFLSAKGANAFQVVRNGDWLSKVSMIDFLRDTGKLFSVNAMISKDSVRERLENREQGISFTEFSYMLLQAYDFHWLFKHKKCRLQIGGSDQWGNITAGLDVIRRKEGSEASAFALTFPLITTSAGTKFGKTESGTVWLSPEKTSPYKFYQFWLNTGDEDSITFLKLFSETSLEDIEALANEMKKAPEKRSAQKFLARLMTELLHGEEERKRAEHSSEVLFSGSIESLDSKSLLEIFSDVPSTSIKKSELDAGIALSDLLVKTTISKSKGEARRLIDGGGIYANNIRQSEAQALITTAHCIEGKALLLRSGKKNYHLVKVEG